MTLSSRFRFPYIGSGPVLVSVLFTAAVIASVWKKIHGIEMYPDPVASRAAWFDLYKTKDFLVVKYTAGLIIFFGLFLSLLCRCIATAESQIRADVLTALNELLLASLIPAAWGLALSCSLSSDTFPPFDFYAAFPIVAIFAMLSMLRFRKTLRAEVVVTTGGGMMLCVLLAVFAGMAILLGATRVIPVTIPHLLGTQQAVAIAAVVVVSVALLVQWILSKSGDDFERRVLLTLKCVQIPLPLLFFYMVPPPLSDPLHRYANPYPHTLVITLAIFCIVGWWFMWRRFTRPVTESRPSFSLTHALAPAAIAGIVLYLRTGSATLPEAYRDYFHYGEQLTPWQQWWDFGKRPYVDYVPVHGLMAMMRGFFSQFFFDGTVASFTCSDVLLNGCGAMALALGMCLLVTPLGALFLVFGALCYFDRFIFLAPAMFLIASPSLLKKPATLLSIWIVLSVLMVAYNPAIGPAFAAGTIPIGLWLAIRLLRENPLGLTTIVLVTAVVGLAGWEILPIRAVGIQFTHFVVDNAWTNEVAHGIMWQEGFNTRLGSEGGINSSQFLFEMVRVGWAPVCVFAAALFWKEFQREPDSRRASLLVLSASVPPVMLLTVPWILGRIDPGALGRSGSLAHVAIDMVLPALVILYAARERLIPLMLVTALIVGFVYPVQPPAFDPSCFIPNAICTRDMDPNVPMIDGKQIGLPRLGQVPQPDPNFIKDLLDLKQILTEFLKPGETYLDMTNQTALYYYLDLPCPTRYASFVATNSRLISGELDQLKEHPVHVVMIGPAGWLDDVPASLRNYELYRYYALKYFPVQRGQWLFMLDPDRFPQTEPLGSEDQLQLLDSVFAKPHLLRLPVSWGQSWKRMQNRFDHVAFGDAAHITRATDVDVHTDGHLVPTGPAVFWDYSIPKKVTDGTTADFLKITYDDQPTDPAWTRYSQSTRPDPVPNGAEAAMVCYWSTPDGKFFGPIPFKAQPGELLIPLGAYPRWLLGKSPTTLRFNFQNPKTVNWFSISKIEFLHLRQL